MAQTSHSELVKVDGSLIAQNNLARTGSDKRGEFRTDIESDVEPMVPSED